MYPCIVLFSIVFFIGCTNKKGQELDVPANCTTGTVSYTMMIGPILMNNGCTFCHVSFSPPGGVDLNSYEGVKTVAQNGRLFGAITHAPGYKPMPRSDKKIDACDIAKIKFWIDAGAPNN